MNTEKKKLLLAYLVSLVVAIVGAIGWGIAYYFEFFAAIVAYLSVFIMFKVYEIFSKPNKWTYIWVIGISVILNLVACIVVIAILMPGYNVFELIFSNGKLRSAFFSDVFFSILFTLAGVISVISNNKKKQKRQQYVINQYEMEKIKNDLRENQEQNEVSEDVINELKEDMKNIQYTNDVDSVVINEEQVNNENKKDN